MRANFYNQKERSFGQAEVDNSPPKIVIDKSTQRVFVRSENYIREILQWNCVDFEPEDSAVIVDIRKDGDI